MAQSDSESRSNRWPAHSANFWRGLLAGVGVGLLIGAALVELGRIQATEPMELMRILVCGGRAFSDTAKVFDVLDEPHWRNRITEIIQGGANGTDAIARDWAESRGVRLRTYIAGKKPTGSSSWSKGNQRMLGEGNPCLVVAFPGVQRTADMIRRAKAAGVTVLEIQSKAR